MAERLRQGYLPLTILLVLVLYATLFIPSPYLRALAGVIAAVALIVMVLLQGRALYNLSGMSSADSEQTGVRERVEPEAESSAEDAGPAAPQQAEQPSEELHEQMQTDAHRHVMEALAGMARVLPILNQQLQAVIDYTEEASMELSRSFISINRKAKEQVQDVRRIFGAISEGESNGSAGGESESALVAIRSNLNSLTEGLDTLLEQIKKNSDSIHSVLRQTKSIEEIVATSSEITENSRVLSINATIEAARAGEHGSGFAVVAGEFKQMTEKSEEATAEIEETVKMITQLISQVQNEIEESKEMSRRLGEQTKTTGQESVDKIDAMIDEAKTDLEKLSGQAEAFAKDINSIIMSIQFQDITRQRIEHVIEPLQEFADDLEKIGGYIEHIDQADSIQQLSNFDSAVDRLKQKYTMEAEKELMEKSLKKGDE
ncbi:MAG: methyl-accepting chemotaxis protein [bacterium]